MMTKRTKEGERRRDAALSIVRTHNAVHVWAAQFSLLTAMRSRANGEGSADDCTPDGHTHTGNAPWIGAAVRQLAERKLIERIGYVRSARPSRKGNEVKRWRLRDAAAADVAIATLRCRLDSCAPPPTATGGDATLFGL